MDSVTNHTTVQPPSKEEQAQRRGDVAMEMLRSMNEDWEYISETEKRDTIRNVIRVLEN